MVLEKSVSLVDSFEKIAGKAFAFYRYQERRMDVYFAIIFERYSFYGIAERTFARHCWAERTVVEH